MTIKLEAANLEKDTKLVALDDIREQLETMKAHHDSMEVSKQEL